MAGDRRRGDAAVGGATCDFARPRIEMLLSLTLILRGRKKSRLRISAIRFTGVGSGYCRWFKVSAPLDLYYIAKASRIWSPG